MSIIKSLLDGIGTGAGVAWPFFGIFTATVGFGAGSVFALMTGSIAALAFCAVTGIIFYWSYRNIQNETIQLKNKLSTFPVDTTSNSSTFPPPETSTLVRVAFTAAFGAFGAVAGCTAGFMGLLSGLGFTIGFVTMPIIGWAALGFALGLAAFVAWNAVTQEKKHHDMKCRIKACKNQLKSSQPSEAPNAETSPTHYPPPWETSKTRSVRTQTDEPDSEQVPTCNAP